MCGLEDCDTADPQYSSLPTGTTTDAATLLMLCSFTEAPNNPVQQLLTPDRASDDRYDGGSSLAGSSSTAA